MRIARTFTLIVALLALAAACLPQEASAAQTFAQWVERFWPVARAAGIKRETYDRAFKGMTPDPKVIEAANFQPEYVKPIGEYIDRVVSDKRIAAGKQKLEENKALLDVLEKRYGVDRTIIVAIWGLESNYGTQPGDMNVIRSLATLAYYNTKASFARQQLITALKIVQRGDIPVEQMNGSWAGAMGHTQFIPTTYQSFAVDYDGDGKRNIWYDVPDALASTASYLKHANWQAGQTWGYEVTLPKGFNPKKVSERTLRSLGDWQKIGIKRVGRRALPASRRQGRALRSSRNRRPCLPRAQQFPLHPPLQPGHLLCFGGRASVGPAERLRAVRPPLADRREPSLARSAHRAAEAAGGQGPVGWRYRRDHRAGNA